MQLLKSLLKVGLLQKSADVICYNLTTLVSLEQGMSKN